MVSSAEPSRQQMPFPASSCRACSGRGRAEPSRNPRHTTSSAPACGPSRAARRRCSPSPPPVPSTPGLRGKVAAGASLAEHRVAAASSLGGSGLRFLPRSPARRVGRPGGARAAAGGAGVPGPTDTGVALSGLPASAHSRRVSPSRPRASEAVETRRPAPPALLPSAKITPAAAASASSEKTPKRPGAEDGGGPGPAPRLPARGRGPGAGGPRRQPACFPQNGAERAAAASSMGAAIL